MSTAHPKILVGRMIHESNSFHPKRTTRESFEVIRGAATLDKLAVTPLFRESGVEMVPTLYANAMPSGIVEKDTFLELADVVLATAHRKRPFDGVWLYLHGSMEVDQIGSGEAYLLAELRTIVGPDVPIALTLDFHANVSPKLVENANVICGYRTAPHVDMEETQIRAGRLLLRCIREKRLPRPVMVHVPMITPGDALVTTIEPGKTLIEELEKTDRRPGVFCASLFGGQPWMDIPDVGPSAIVAAVEDRKIAIEEARRLARVCWEARKSVHFEVEAVEPEEAIERAFRTKEGPVFISDSGDNTTGGAPGDNAWFLDLLLHRGVQNTLLAGITDAPAVTRCCELGPGKRIQCRIGGTLDPHHSPAIQIQGVVKKTGRILGWCGEDAGRSAVIGVDGLDVLVTERSCGIVSREILASAGLNVLNYRLIVVKLGYLWDDLRQIAKRSILALTTGVTSEDMMKLPFQNVSHPIYPLDGDFDWDPSQSPLTEQ